MQPLSLKLERRASMLMVLTGVGVFIYLAQMEKNYEQAELVYWCLCSSAMFSCLEYAISQ